MSSFLSSLFGGSESESHATSTPTEMQAPEFQALRSPFANALGNLMTNGPPQYGGPMTAGVTAPEQGSLDTLGQTTGQGTARAGVINDTLAGKYLNSNPFREAAIKSAQRPTLQGLEETLSRALPGRFTAAGHMTQSNENGGGGSSAFDRSAAIATRGAADAIGDIATKISFGDYEAERGRQQQAIGIDQAEVDTTIKTLQAQALPRLIQEMGITRGIDLFKTNIAAVLDTLKTIAGVTAPVIANKMESTSSSESSKGIFSSIGLPGIKFPT